MFIGLPRQAKRVGGIALACTAALAVFMVQLGRPLLDDVRLADTGTLAMQSEGTTQCSKVAVLVSCTVRARYLAGGA